MTRHQCTICEKTYATKAILETHIETVHEKKKQYQCEKCENSFTTKYSLKYHTKAVHEKQESSQNEETNSSKAGSHFMTSKFDLSELASYTLENFNR